eukprot:scaffold19724_cov45-Phaeocystis_antarctica.AAC.1
MGAACSKTRLEGAIAHWSLPSAGSRDKRVTLAACADDPAGPPRTTAATRAPTCTAARAATSRAATFHARSAAASLAASAAGSCFAVRSASLTPTAPSADPAPGSDPTQAHVTPADQAAPLGAVTSTATVLTRTSRGLRTMPSAVPYVYQPWPYRVPWHHTAGTATVDYAGLAADPRFAAYVTQLAAAPVG